MASKAETTARERLKATGNVPPDGIKTGSDLHLCEMLLAELDSSRASNAALRAALGKCYTQLMFEAERYPREGTSVALTLIHEAVMDARKALGATTQAPHSHVPQIDVRELVASLK